MLALQSIPTLNQIISSLKEMETLRKLLPEVSALPLVVYTPNLFTHFFVHLFFLDPPQCMSV